MLRHRVCHHLLAVLLAASSVAQAESPPTSEEHPSSRSKWIAAGTVAGLHVGYAVWSYFAWYRGDDLGDFHEEKSTWFDEVSYAGGADKVGHFWANYALSRATTAALVSAGWDRVPSALVAAGLSTVSFTLTEVEDGFTVGFDKKDLAANLAGAGLAILMDTVPGVDRAFDFKLQYFPSRDYRRALRDSGSIDVGQDYSGQSYLLSFHPSSITRLVDADWGYWSHFVDLTIGFETRNYSPVPEPRVELPRQTVYAGLSVNMQGVLRHLFSPSRARTVGIGAFEAFALPYTTFRYVEGSRRNEQP